MTRTSAFFEVKNSLALNIHHVHLKFSRTSHENTSCSWRFFSHTVKDILLIIRDEIFVFLFNSKHCGSNNRSQIQNYSKISFTYLPFFQIFVWFEFLKVFLEVPILEGNSSIIILCHSFISKHPNLYLTAPFWITDFNYID